MKISITEASWALCILIGFLSVVACGIGHNVFICSSVPEALISTLAMMMGFFLFLPQHVLGGLFIFMVVVTIAVRLLSSIKFIGDRKWLFSVVPVATLLLTYVFAHLFGSSSVCSMGSWQ